MYCQVEGKNGMAVLKNKMAKGGVPTLYHGALAASGATFVGHYPWCVCFIAVSLPLSAHPP